MFQIKDFGNNTNCSNIEELREEIKRYKNKSVSILVKGQFNLNKPIFVNVLENGCLIDTYTGESISFEQIQKESL